MYKTSGPSGIKRPQRNGIRIVKTPHRITSKMHVLPLSRSLTSALRFFFSFLAAIFSSSVITTSVVDVVAAASASAARRFFSRRANLRAYIHDIPREEA